MYLLSLEWKRVGVMDNESGDDRTDDVRVFYLVAYVGLVW